MTTTISSINLECSHALLGKTNLKYYSQDIPLLTPMTLMEMGEHKQGEKQYLAMGEHKVVCIKNNQPYYLYTNGLAPCVAVLAFCKLKNGETLLGCYHSLENADYTISMLYKPMTSYQYYNQEKIDFFVVGGFYDDDTEYSCKEHDSFCSTLLKMQNVNLKGILFDPFQISRQIEEKLTEETQELSGAELEQSRKIASLFSIEAGITSMGVPFFHKRVENFSFEYNSKYEDYHAICNYVQSNLGYNIFDLSE